MKLIVTWLLLCGLAFAGSTSTWQVVQVNTNGGNISPSNTMVFTSLVKLSGTAIAWDDLQCAANQSARVGVDDVSQDDTLLGIAFAATASTNSTNDHIWWARELPHKYKLQGNLGTHVHWWQTNADQTNVFWLRYQWNLSSETNLAAFTLIGPATNVHAYSAGTMNQLSLFPAISGTGKNTAGSGIRLKLYRDGDFGTGSITVREIGVHHQIDGFGSDAETSKSY